LAGALGGLGWLCWRGIRRGRQAWSLAGLAVVWVAGVTLITWRQWPPGLLMLSLAFAGSVALVTWLAWREGSQRAEIARLRRLADARSDRVAALGHEIRTPLAMIKGAADLLLEGNPGPLTLQQHTFLETISQNCEHTIALAEDLLIQACIEAGLFKLRLEPVDMMALARQAVRAIRTLTASRGQFIRLDYPQVLDRIHADPRLITQVLTNLLQNASQHTSQGGHIYVTIADNDTGMAISVTDDGAGMSVEERQRLFQRFASGRPLGDGAGLGLVITKQIVELHGGQIMVDTSLGRGTTVLFTLPRWKEQDANGQTTRTGG
jgi:signal transduction histidine kinase